MTPSKIRSGNPAASVSVLCLMAWLGLPAIAAVSQLPVLTGFGWKTGLPLHLLTDAAVRKDLELSEEARQKVRECAADIEAVREVTRNRAVLNRLLTDQQRNRLDQIHLQQAKLIDVFHDSNVIQDLGGFSQEQRKAIRAAYQHYLARRESLPGKLQSSGVKYTEEELFKELEEVLRFNQEVLDRKLLEILTANQAKKFAELKGKPLQPITRESRP